MSLLVTANEYNNHTYSARLSRLRQFETRAKAVIALYAGIFIFFEKGKYDESCYNLLLITWIIGVVFMYTAYIGFNEYKTAVAEILEKDPQKDRRKVKPDSWPTHSNKFYINGTFIVIILIIAIGLALKPITSKKDATASSNIINNNYNYPVIHDTVKQIIHIKDSACTVSRKKVLENKKKQN